MFKIKWFELFPTKLSVCIFVSYVFLFVSYGVFIKASQNSSSKYNYNVALVVLLTEIVKLCTSIGFFYRGNREKTLISEIKCNKTLLILYFVPSLLYCAYNNLAFKNLSAFDPTTYYLLLQFRVVITALLFQIIFKKYLTTKQWLSLVLLTLGCILKELDFTTMKSMETSKEGSSFNYFIILIIIQSFLSCIAGVYNEYLIKGRGIDTDIFLQNIFMYVDSIICNSVVLFIQGDLYNILSKKHLESLLNINVFVIIINSAAIGIVTSFFLKTMNSILKTFASSIELIFTAVVCYIAFGIEITHGTILAIFIVILAVILYSQNPVNNQQTRSEAKEHLVENDSVSDV